jgi:predicted metal-dependent HD superfamily phosphohydrolase
MAAGRSQIRAETGLSAHYQDAKMSWPGLERWSKLLGNVGASNNANAWYEILTRAYAEPHRRYHNQEHIAECLVEFDSARHLAENPDPVELALWLHDAVYDSKAADNEEQSAAMAKQCLESLGRVDLCQTVAILVMATKLHDTTTSGRDAALVVDIDLSILGRDEKRFAEYEAGIRAEYGWVPGQVFKEKRAEILQSFLSRPRIYVTEHFFNRYERTARENLEVSIRKLAL